MPLHLSLSQLKRLMPNAINEYARAFVAHQDQFDKWGITANVARYSMFLANVAHECGEFHAMEESGNYRAETIVKTWPSRFSSISAAAPFAHNAQKLFNSTYANRMGNGPASSGDGFKYRGRGEPQVTGKDGYKNVSAVAKLDLLGSPDLAKMPEWMNAVGGAFWAWKGLNRLADEGNFSALVSRWNGGHIGYAARLAYLKKAKAILMEIENQSAPQTFASVEPVEPIAPADIPAPPGESEPEAPIIVADDSEAMPVPHHDMEAAQRRLRALGYFLGSEDGDGGTFTRDAILSFQADNSIPTTGELDEATLRELPNAGPKHISETRATATADTLRDKGSNTVSLADKVKNWGKGLLGLGGASAVADAASPLETIKGKLDQASEWRGYLEPMQGMWEFLKDHQLLLFIAAGVAIWFFGSKIIAQRVADERSGANRGR